MNKDKQFFIEFFQTFREYKYALCYSPEQVDEELKKEGARKCFVMYDEADYWWLDKQIRVDHSAFTMGFSATSFTHVNNWAACSNE